MRDNLESALLQLPASVINGDTAHRLSHVTNIRFDGIDGSALMTSLSRELAIASGSACTSANPEPSHVLQAMGLSRNQAKASLRISLGKYNTEEEIATATVLIKNAVSKLRETSMEWKLRQNYQ